MKFLYLILIALIQISSSTHFESKFLNKTFQAPNSGQFLTIIYQLYICSFFIIGIEPIIN